MVYWKKNQYICFSVGAFNYSVNNFVNVYWIKSKVWMLSTNFDDRLYKEMTYMKCVPWHLLLTLQSPPQLESILSFPGFQYSPFHGASDSPLPLLPNQSPIRSSPRPSPSRDGLKNTAATLPASLRWSFNRRLCRQQSLAASLWALLSELDREGREAKMFCSARLSLPWN